MEEFAALPEEILQASRCHLGPDLRWRTEAEWYTEIMQKEVPLTTSADLWFFVTNTWDIYPNAGTLEPWWKLGNLKTDSLETIIRRFEQDEIPGLQIILHYPQNTLAEEYGDPHGRKIYSSRTNLLDLYRGKHCEKLWQSIDRTL